MIRILFMLLLFTCAWNPLMAQQFNGGLMGGLAATTVAGDAYAGFNKIGLYGGGFVNLEISETSLIQMELAYFQKGARFNEDPDMPDKLAYILRLHYVELPLLFQYRMAEFRLEAGLSADFLVSVSEELDYLEQETDHWKRTAFNSILGIKYDLNDRLTASLRSVNSINSIRKDQVTGNVRRYSQKNYGAFNDAFLLSIYYQF